MINLYLDLGNIMPALLGTTAGFVLGLIALALKEYLDYKKKKKIYNINAEFMINNLRKYLHEDPGLCGDVDVKLLNNYIYEGLVDEAERKIYYRVFDIYMNWKRSFYMPNSKKIQDIDKVKEELSGIIKKLKT